MPLQSSKRRPTDCVSYENQAKPGFLLWCAQQGRTLELTLAATIRLLIKGGYPPFCGCSQAEPVPRSMRRVSSRSFLRTGGLQ